MAQPKLLVIDGKNPTILGRQVVIEFQGEFPNVNITLTANVITPHPTDPTQGVATQLPPHEAMALIGVFVQQALVSGAMKNANPN